MSLVQAVLAGGLVLLAVLAERFFGFQLERRQWVGVILTAIGLAMLAITGEARSGQDSADYSIAAMLAFETALVGLGVMLILSCRNEDRKDQHGVLLGLAAGLLFTTTHVAVKALTGKIDTTVAEVLLSPYLYVAILGGVAAFFASARSLQLGPAVPVIAVTSIAGNASAIPAGIIVFGDPVGHDTLVVAVRMVAFLLVIAAAALIPAPVRAARRRRRRRQVRPAPQRA
jgi:drug/metabolite transporter (DMT)-like permease